MVSGSSWRGESNLFDVLAYIAFALSPITREERVSTHKARIFAHYDDKLRVFLEFVLGESVKQGVAKWINQNSRRFSNSSTVT